MVRPNSGGVAFGRDIGQLLSESLGDFLTQISEGFHPVGVLGPFLTTL